MKATTKVGDTMFDGATKYEVVSTINGTLVLKPVYGNDYHFYVKPEEGPVTRHIDLNAALEAAALPHVKSQLAANEAVREAAKGAR